MSPISDDPEFEPQIMTSADDIYLHMLRLQKARTVISLLLGGTGKPFRSSLLQIDRESGRVAIDEVMPLDGNALLRQAPGLSLSALSDAGSSYWKSPAGALQAGSLDGLPCHWLPLPTELRYMQRRRSFRASFLISQTPPLVILDEEGRETARGEMLDVSEHGCRVLIKLGATPEWAEVGQSLQLRIEPQGQPAFEVRGDVRHAAVQDRPEAFVIGLQFQQVAPPVARRLGQLVVQVQRERRRQQLDMGTN